jgi:protein-S-isoprenylcysteine O-methyltransferase Ste14
LKSNLYKTLLFKVLPGIIGIMLMLFLPAGTFRYWQAWVWLGVILIPMVFVLIYLIRKDPALLERRLKSREKETRQSWIISLSIVVLLAAFILPGFDHRWGWSHVPAAVVIIADLLIFLGYFIYARVLYENSYASRVVEVEKDQKVISSGPYAVIRHPMYAGIILTYLFSPLALGSWWAVLPALCIFIVLYLRIINEEKTLARELPGYTEYMQKVKYRLIPGIW